MDMISKKLANDRLYAYHGGRFWFWDEGRSIWKESHLLAKKYNLNHEYDKLLTPEDFLSDPSQFQALEDYEVDYILKNALQNAQPARMPHPTGGRTRNGSGAGHRNGRCRTVRQHSRRSQL